MILFAGIPSEAPLALAIAAADAAGVPHTVFNQRHAAHCALTLQWRPDGPDGTLQIGGTALPLRSLSGIYARMTDVATLPEHRWHGRAAPDARALAQTRAVCTLFDDVLDVLPCSVVNRPAAMGSNLSKPCQAQAITAAGLLTPPTLVTNDPAAVRAFHAEHRRIVFKSVSAVRSIVREWSPQDGRDLGAVARLPTQFQAWVPGVDVRVHVVGRRVFATEVDCAAVDYRYAERDGLALAMRATQLPARVADACIALTAALDLVLSGIDLKRTPDGEWYCFEVNPSPAYSWFQDLGGQAIAQALVQHLAAAPA